MNETKITLKNEYGEYSISSYKTDLNINDTFELLIIPLLLASGYSDETIKEYLNEKV